MKTPSCSYFSRTLSEKIAQMVLFIVLLTLPFSWCLPTIAKAEPASEMEIRTLFLYQLARFASWPETPIRHGGQPFRFCVMDDELAPLLSRIVLDDTLNGRPLIVVYPVDIKKLGECHILYTTAPEPTKPAIQSLLRRATAASILTVSDQKKFVEKGGMVALIRKQGRIHPIINLDMVNQGSLKINSKLLRLSTIISSSQEGDP